MDACGGRTVSKYEYRTYALPGSIPGYEQALAASMEEASAVHTSYVVYDDPSGYYAPWTPRSGPQTATIAWVGPDWRTWVMPGWHSLRVDAEVRRRLRG